MNGVFIAGMGLPGSGKSSVLSAVADLLTRNGKQATLHREPEESEWPAAVTNRSVGGCITALTWFRSIRVPMLYQASSERDDGKIAILDSYYDKLIHLYIREPQFRWLIHPEDPYFSVYTEIARLDFENLPNADCVVTFSVDEDRWKELVKGRGRKLDRDSEILNYHDMQTQLFNATEIFCNQTGALHIHYENSHTTLAKAALGLVDELKYQGVLPC